MSTLTAQRATIRLHPDDNVVVAREPLATGTELPVEHVVMKGHVLPGHKIATREIQSGGPVSASGRPEAGSGGDGAAVAGSR